MRQLLDYFYRLWNTRNVGNTRYESLCGLLSVSTWQDAEKKEEKGRGSVLPVMRLQQWSPESAETHGPRNRLL